VNTDDEGSIALLRRFEPALRFTLGEQFFPMDTAAYVAACGLWEHRANVVDVCVAPAGTLTLERLGELSEGQRDGLYYLKPEATLAKSGAAVSHRKLYADFHAGGGRLARVGYISRLTDAIAALSLLVRGHLPTDAAAEAAATYQQMQAEHEIFRYCGRVLHQAQWTVLQYWFFYAFNDWRAGYLGANNHEADWEMMCIYLAEAPDGDLVPEWTAYAAHNAAGADLRRRWDDPELEKVAEHPVIYAGAGSHASYFRRGEYLTEISLPLVKPLERVSRTARNVWYSVLRQYGGEGMVPGQDGTPRLFPIPFIDYARGDGFALGPGQKREWDEPQLLDTACGWVGRYSGLWGVYARDPFSGENAPTGPMYGDGGSIRRKWYDPVGWTGLDRVPTSYEAASTARAELAALEARDTRLRSEIAEQNRQLVALGIEELAARDQPYLERRRVAQRVEIGDQSHELAARRQALTECENQRAALERYIVRLQAGEREPARAHLHRPYEPMSEEELRVGKSEEIWAAVSVGLLLIGFVALVEFSREYMISGLITLIVVFAFLEAWFRRRVAQFLTFVAMVLAVAAAVVLLLQFGVLLAALAVLAAGIYILWQNLRELWR
jgi:hypothetical protein